MLQAELLGRRSIYIASTIILAQFTVSGYLETGRPTASKKVPGVDPENPLVSSTHNKSLRFEVQRARVSQALVPRPLRDSGSLLSLHLMLHPTLAF